MNWKKKENKEKELNINYYKNVKKEGKKRGLKKKNNTKGKDRKEIER